MSKFKDFFLEGVGPYPLRKDGCFVTLLETLKKLRSNFCDLLSPFEDSKLYIIYRSVNLQNNFLFGEGGCALKVRI